jgi:hypothetical protein
LGLPPLRPHSPQSPTFAALDRCRSPLPEIAEADRELPRAAAKIEHSMILSQTDQFSDAPDQSGRVGNASGAIVQCRIFETVRVKGRRTGHGLHTRLSSALTLPQQFQLHDTIGPGFNASIPGQTRDRHHGDGYDDCRAGCRGIHRRHSRRSRADDLSADHHDSVSTAKARARPRSRLIEA